MRSPTVSTLQNMKTVTSPDSIFGDTLIDHTIDQEDLQLNDVIKNGENDVQIDDVIMLQA